MFFSGNRIMTLIELPPFFCAELIFTTLSQLFFRLKLQRFHFETFLIFPFIYRAHSVRGLSERSQFRYQCGEYFFMIKLSTTECYSTSAGNPFHLFNFRQCVSAEILNLPRKHDNSSLLNPFLG